MSTTGTATTFEFKGVIRFHTKSKRGCLTCRKRRIKTNLQELLSAKFRMCTEAQERGSSGAAATAAAGNGALQTPHGTDTNTHGHDLFQNNASLHYRNLHFFLLRPCNRHHIPQHPASAIVAEPTPPARYIILHGPSPRSPIPRIPNPTGYIVHPLIGKLR
uniref:Uncharacterized protein n=1 Tax=Moniliophthora roreri TaxID=221103 RepID=A0A0W0FA94_MONRR